MQYSYALTPAKLFGLAYASNVLHGWSYCFLPMLTTTNVMHMESKREAAAKRKHGETRVKVYSPSGEQIGIAGVGEGENKLTFPTWFLVGDALRATNWIRYATAEECQLDKGSRASFATEEQKAKWWRISEFKPLSLIHDDVGCESIVAVPEEQMGFWGNRMLALAQTSAMHVTEKPCDDVDDIRTPSTPSSS